jgi:hypothetical protein
MDGQLAMVQPDHHTDDGLPSTVVGAHIMSNSAPIAAFLGIVLILVAIPFGLMIAPLALGIVLLWFALRRVDGALDPRADAAA